MVGKAVGAYAAFEYAGLAKTLEESGREVLAKAVNSSLIVIGTHGRRGFDRLLLGSVAEGVMHHAEVPVLLVQSKPNKS
jgi:nucleotide-binding universal stress UspA family protein